MSLWEYPVTFTSTPVWRWTSDEGFLVYDGETGRWSKYEPEEAS